MRNFYLVGILFCMLMSGRSNAGPPLLNEKPTVATPSLALNAPYFTPDNWNYYVIQTDISFRVSRNNPTGVLEVWRSKTAEENYVLAGTATSEFFYDYNLPPRTEFKYKMRVVDGSEVSPWSEIKYTRTESKYYDPTIVVERPGYDEPLMQMTDNTYYDESYTVFRIDGNGTTELYTFSLPDSGQVYTLWDDPLPRPGVVTYRIQLNLPWYVETDPNSYYYDFQFEAQLQTPVLENPEEWEYVCGSQNKLLYSSSGDQSFHDTEIYRSLNVDGPYTLIATVPSTQSDYVDDVAPRVNYYYKVRHTWNGMFSEYSNIVYYEGSSDWYVPGFEVTPNGSAVQIKITDNSYADYAYRIIRDDLPAYVETVLMSDSGQVYIYNDSLVQPGTTYDYYLEATTDSYCDDWPYEDIVAHVQITTPVPQDYVITSFTLVDPVTDTDVGPLVDGQKISITSPHFLNIRANADAKTKSVMFFLNNKRRSDNGGPIFSYFPEKNGDYADGLFAQGIYVLEATPYSEKNGKGIKGETIVIEFEVLGPDADYTIKNFSLIDPETEQEIGPLVDGAIVDVGLAANIRANTDPKTKAVMFFLNNKRRADNGAPIFSYFPEKNGDYAPGLVVTGHYVLEATPSSEKNAQGVIGETVTIQFDVVCSSCDADQARLARVGEVSFFPNPVVSTSQLKIQTLPGSDVRIQVVDQLGQPRTSLITLTPDENGALQHPLSALNLGKGVYLLSVEVNGQRVMKRFVVE